MVEKVLPISDPFFPDLFQLSYRWIYDSGASRHFCSKRDATKFIQYARNIQAVKIGTASGSVEANQVLDVSIDRLGGLLTEVMLLPNSPSLISAGRIGKSGYTYVWAHGYLPCLINNDTGAQIVFDVSSNLPIIMKGGIFDTISDPALLSALSGVLITEDYIHISRVRSHQAKPGQAIYAEGLCDEMSKSRMVRIAGQKALVNRIVEENDVIKPMGIGATAYVKSQLDALAASHLPTIANEKGCRDRSS